MNTSSNVWLVTGSSSGLGRKIAEAVLGSGDLLLATARDPGHLDDLVGQYGDHVRTAPLDVTDESAHLSLDRERGTRARVGYLTNQPRTFGISVLKKF